MKKNLLAIGLVLALVLAAPVATRAESLNVAQLRAIIASLQAQLNVLITKLQLQIQQQNSSTTTSQSSITITSPQTGDKLIAGSNVNINFSSAWSYDTNCFNRLELLDTSGKVIGSLMPTKGQQTVVWNTASIPSYTCGTGNVDVKINPGTYRFRIKTISADGNNEVVIYNSGYFTITSSTSSNKPPVISALWTDDQLVINKNINWGISFYDQDAGGVLSYKLSCGDGNNGQLVYGEANLYFVCNYKVAGIYRVVATVSDKGGLYGTKEASVKISDTSSTPSLKATLNVTALNGAIQCFKAPCEFPLSGAQVTVYDTNKALVGNQIVGSSGVATFSNLNPGTYTVYVGASGYTQTSGQTVGLVSGQSASVKIPVFLAR